MQYRSRDGAKAAIPGWDLVAAALKGTQDLE